MKQPPRVIVLEGLDYSGKSTLAGTVVTWLQAFGRDVVCFRDPGSTLLAERIRAIVKDGTIPCSPESQALMFMAARLSLSALIQEAQAEKECDVVIDRWWYSTWAYQAAQGVSETLIESISREMVPVKVDLALYLDVSPDIQVERMGVATGRNLNDRFDSATLSFRVNVRQRYNTMVERGWLARVNADQSAGMVLRSVTDCLLPLIA